MFSRWNAAEPIVTVVRTCFHVCSLLRTGCPGLISPSLNTQLWNEPLTVLVCLVRLKLRSLLIDLVLLHTALLTVWVDKLHNTMFSRIIWGIQFIPTLTQHQQADNNYGDDGCKYEP